MCWVLLLQLLPQLLLCRTVQALQWQQARHCMLLLPCLLLQAMLLSSYQPRWSLLQGWCVRLGPSCPNH
jgi:hypothetical protein